MTIGPMTMGQFFFFRAESWRKWVIRVGRFGIRVLPLEGHKPLYSESYGDQRAWHIERYGANRPRRGVCIARVKGFVKK